MFKYMIAKPEENPDVLSPINADAPSQERPSLQPKSTMNLDSTFYLSAIAATVVVILYHRSRKLFTVDDIPGPSSPSFLTGSLGELLRAQAGEVDFKWQSQYGNVLRFKGPFGENRLLISDPKAAHHVLRGYKWDRPKDMRLRSLLISGPGITFVQGHDHKRQRKVMSPAFGAPEAKALVPIFASAAGALATKWKDLLAMSRDETEVFNIPAWTSRATLDAIGHAGFDYDFGALENRDNRLATVYSNLFADMFAAPTNGMLISSSLSSSRFLPLKFLSWLMDHSSNERVGRGRDARKVAAEVARVLVAEKSEELMSGQREGNLSKDVMSLLVRSNMSGDERTKMSNEELLAQMQTVFLAGHETTANSLSWTLLELSRHPEIQDRLRKEIHLKEQELLTGGRTGFTAEDFDSLPYLNAVLKESLRYHPVGVYVEKVALADDCISLSESIMTTSGKEISEIPVAKGQRITLSIAGYNRNTAVFGNDAHVFNPGRWLDAEDGSGSGSRKGTSVGVYANLLTFSGGIRSCIGWRFAVVELQTFLVELVGNFEFSLTPECDKIRREACAVMLPTIEGELEKGVQCPLRVQCAKREV
ncbi:hypothetical protein V5O48_008414 [Marasmius crinis-equi]|uniref:Cytochrome P450 n=1 Tax=Marasmius crinis-equi TaxID=585013 RepID=A0ABR3FE02_9AGAR